MGASIFRKIRGLDLATLHTYLKGNADFRGPPMSQENRQKGREVTAVLDRTLARTIVDDGIRRYINKRREMVPEFVEKHFSTRGAWDLNKRGVGADILKAPINTLLVAPTLALEGCAFVAGKAGKPDVARRLRSQNLFFKTDVAQELEYLLYTELFELPYQHQGEKWRKSAADALAREILCDHRLVTQIEPMVLAAAREAAKPGGRQWLEETLTAYLGSRSATTELSTLIMCLSTGAALTQQLTPGLISLGPAVIHSIEGALTAHGIATSSTVMGYAAPGAIAAAGGTAALVVSASVLSAVSGVVTDPIQKALGLHERRLMQVLDLMEEAFIVGERGPFVVADQYVGRIMDLADVGMALWHARPI